MFFIGICIYVSSTILFSVRIGVLVNIKEKSCQKVEEEDMSFYDYIFVRWDKDWL